MDARSENSPVDIGMEPAPHILAKEFSLWIDKEENSVLNVVEKDPKYLFAVVSSRNSSYIERRYYRNMSDHLFPLRVPVDPETGLPKLHRSLLKFNEAADARFCPSGSDFVLASLSIASEGHPGIGSDYKSYVEFDSNMNYLNPEREYRDSSLQIAHPGWGTLRIYFDDITGGVKTVRFDVSYGSKRFKNDYNCEITVDPNEPQKIRIEGTDGTVSEYTQKPEDPNIYYKRVYRGVEIDSISIPKVFNMEHVMDELVRPETLENPYTKATRDDETWRMANLEKVFQIDWKKKAVPLTEEEKEERKKIVQDLQ